MTAQTEEASQADQQASVQRLDDGQRPTLRQGASGPFVGDLQQRLLPSAPDLVPDQQFGSLTRNAVVAFQGARGLVPDGVVGPKTWTALDGGTEASPDGGGGAAGAPGPRPKATDPADDFRIKGIFPDAAEHQDTIYFECAKSEIPDSELAKIAALAGDANAKLVLRGTASEEGAGNEGLVNARIAAVGRALAKAGHQGKRDAANEFVKGEGHIDYRSMRKVRVLKATDVANEPNCKKDGPLETCASNVGAAFDRADAILGAAISKLASPASLTPADKANFQAIFHTADPGEMTTVASTLGDLRSHLSATKSRRQEPKQQEPGKPFHRCNSDCNSSCEAGAKAFNQGDGSNSRTTFCHGFTQMTAPIAPVANTVEETQAHIVMHEGAHGTGGLAARDFSKFDQRAFPLLNTAQAKTNADCYAVLARNLEKPGSVTLAPLRTDTVTVGAGGEAGTREAIAWLDRWLEAADFHTSQLYGAIRERIGSGWVPGETFETAMAAVAVEFPVSAPPAAPTRRDQEKVAAINDRINTMRTALSTKKSALTVTEAATTTWAAGPGFTVTVQPGFSALPLRQRVDLLMAAIAQATPDIRAAQEPNYSRLIPKLSALRNPGFAP